MILFLLIVTLSAVLFWYVQEHRGYDQAINYGKKANLTARALVLGSMPGSLVFGAVSIVTCLLERDLKVSSALIKGHLKGYRRYLEDCAQVIFLGQLDETRRGMTSVPGTESQSS